MVGADQLDWRTGLALAGLGELQVPLGPWVYTPQLLAGLS